MERAPPSPEPIAIRVTAEADVAAARALVRDRAAEAGLPAAPSERLVTAVSELAHNQLRHAGTGEVAVRVVERAGVPGIEVVCADRGPGLADPTAALLGAGSSAGGLGVGFSSIFRLADEVDVDSRRGEGTRVRVRAFAADVPAAPQVAVLGRPVGGEIVSGDDAAFSRLGGALRVVVADGLGHGPEARRAAVRAAAHLDEPIGDDPAAYVQACNDWLLGTRGAVVAAARISDHLELGAMGNVGCRVLRRVGGQSIPAQPGTLGQRPGRPKVTLQSVPLRPRDLVVLFTDGLSSRLHVDDRPELFAMHPLAVADHLLRTFGQGHDDALVVVVR